MSRGVTTQRHRSVGAFNREPTITLLLYAERASGVRSVVIARRYFFDGYCRGDIASGDRNVAIARRYLFKCSQRDNFLPATFTKTTYCKVVLCQQRHHPQYAKNAYGKQKCRQTKGVTRYRLFLRSNGVLGRLDKQNTHDYCADRH